MKYIIALCLVVSVIRSQAATVVFDNFNVGGDAAYGVRDATGTLVSDSSFQGILGRFTITNTAISTFFSSGNTASIAAGFSAFDPTTGTFDLFTPGVPTSYHGAFQASESFDTKASVNVFGGTTIYAVFYKGASIAAATELFIAQLASTFPTDPEVGLPLSGTASLSPSGISSLVVGTSGGPNHDYGLGGGPLPTYGLSAVAAVPEPSRAFLLLGAVLGLAMRRRRA